jgi:hypothetical protein
MLGLARISTVVSTRGLIRRMLIADSTPGSCWAIHSRDFRVHDTQNCQILVTVPEILAIMLLSPPLAKMWTPRLK